MHPHPMVFTGQPGSSSLSSQAPSPSSPLQFSSQSQYPYAHPDFNSPTSMPHHAIAGSMDMSHFHHQSSGSPSVASVSSHPAAATATSACHFQSPSISTAPTHIAPHAPPSCVPPPMMPPKTPNSPEAVQALLEENKDLLTAALEYQNIGRVVESAHYQARLHANLLVLATLADRMISSQRLAFPNQNTSQQHGYYTRALPVEDRENQRLVSMNPSQPLLRAKLPASSASSYNTTAAMATNSHGSGEYRLAFGESKRKAKGKFSATTAAGAKESFSKPSSDLDSMHSPSPTAFPLMTSPPTGTTVSPAPDYGSMTAMSTQPSESFSEPRGSFDMPRI